MDDIIQTLNAERAKLLDSLKRIDSMLAVAQGGAQGAARKSKSPKAGKRAGGKGKLKESVLAELQAAGPSGISIKEIASRIGVQRSRLGTWFATTGKRTKEIKRLDRGVYTLNDGSAKDKK